MVQPTRKIILVSAEHPEFFSVSRPDHHRPRGSCAFQRETLQMRPDNNTFSLKRDLMLVSLWIQFIYA
jgi:hypothetical protein